MTTVSPNILPGKTEMTVQELQNIWLPCQYQAAPKPNVTWRKNDVKVSPFNRLRIALEGLYIRNVTEEDAGIYQCSVRNTAGSDIRSIRLNVQSEIMFVNKRRGFFWFHFG